MKALGWESFNLTSMSRQNFKVRRPMSPSGPERFFLHILHFIFFHHCQRVCSETCVPGSRPSVTKEHVTGEPLDVSSALLAVCQFPVIVGGASQHQLQQEAETEKRMFVCLHRKEHERCRREAGYEQQQRRFQGDGYR